MSCSDRVAGARILDAIARGVLDDDPLRDQRRVLRRLRG